MKTHVYWFSKLFKKYLKSALIRSVISTSTDNVAMLRAKPTTTHAAVIDISHSTRFITLLEESWTPRYIWAKLDTARMAK